MNIRFSSSHTVRLVAVVALLLVICGAGSAALTLAAQTGSRGASSTASDARQVDLVDLNKASAEELTTIPGVGQALARRIIEFREKEGPFRRIEDLMKVKGIGEKSFQKMRSHVKVDSKG